MTTIYQLGDERDFRFSSKIEGNLVNPDNLTFEIREPGGIITTYVKDTDEELEPVSTGLWRVLWIMRKSGWHTINWIATGNVNQSEELSFYVPRSNVFGSELPEPFEG